MPILDSRSSWTNLAESNLAAVLRLYDRRHKCIRGYYYLLKLRRNPAFGAL